ncbi:NAD-dependent epimerase/dehydratase family protein [Falsirhodobacter sp. 1013]|uniref:NAD-dependent epimerase/dehydratase family protein n=1 Tax=Falsirhodobacter sp. 1013 TaxID=3417566 RepID=UPI003EB9E93B
MARLLITGAAGLLGQELAERLAPDWNLTLFDLVRAPERGGARILVGDMGDPADVTAAVQGADAILHLACRHGENVTFEETLDANYRGSIALMDAAVANGVSHVVFASSNHGWGLYPRTAAPLAADAPPRPDGWYGINKIWTEAMLSFYADTRGLTATSLRIGNCGASVPDERRTHMWISFDDLAALTTLALTRQGPGHRAVFATADCAAPFFDNSGAKAIGFTPQHHPEDHLDHPGVASEAAGTDIFGRSIGGSYAAANFRADIDIWERAE